MRVCAVESCKHSTKRDYTTENSKITLMSQKASDRIVWIDMEMTGLDPDRNKILEVACIITDPNLKTVSEELEMIIHQPDEELDFMDSWNTHHHIKSGLINSSRASTISTSEGESTLLSFLKRYVPQKTCPLAGNSVYVDRMFLHKQMPLVNEYLHYRIIDVSSIKELVRRWNPALYEAAPQKIFNHRALNDIKETIKELEYYKKHMFQ
ncbi:oligoribonuclease isoform X2 [Belonocnema kinseyi]|uniref:oligoribonuclease isoform X2 n=1 Tax=Belonocnema kinseyi TaxID=2817044 RepID=UPI00143E089E|nr:oligoribonuclease isoform X2 [Belonocnema kinseyi]